mmetsp:Transcript_4296/g.14257  ORF Transcript_4296/g.14257 Transcript_4296/m.14257 type:complete len:269 (-) Transcript_4296:669-1475(-)
MAAARTRRARRPKRRSSGKLGRRAPQNRLAGCSRYPSILADTRAGAATPQTRRRRRSVPTRRRPSRGCGPSRGRRDPRKNLSRSRMASRWRPGRRRPAGRARSGWSLRSRRRRRLPTPPHSCATLSLPKRRRPAPSSAASSRGASAAIGALRPRESTRGSRTRTGSSCWTLRRSFPGQKEGDGQGRHTAPRRRHTAPERRRPSSPPPPPCQRAACCALTLTRLSSSGLTVRGLAAEREKRRGGRAAAAPHRPQTRPQARSPQPPRLVA